MPTSLNDLAPSVGNPAIDQAAKPPAQVDHAKLYDSMVHVESGGNPNAVSPKGARGLMQIMPATGADYGVHDPKQLMDPRVNRRVGTAYMKDLLNKYHGDTRLALAAYNWGPGNVDSGRPFPKETSKYINDVTAHMGGMPPAAAQGTSMSDLAPNVMAGGAQRPTSSRMGIGELVEKGLKNVPKEAKYLAKTAGLGAAEQVPFIGTGVAAYRHKLSGGQQGELAGLTTLAGGGTAAQAWDQMKDGAAHTIKDSDMLHNINEVNQSPLGRAFVAMGLDLPIQTLVWAIASGAGEYLTPHLMSVMSATLTDGSQALMTEALAAPTAEGARTAATLAGKAFKAEKAIRRTVEGAAFGVTNAAQQQLVEGRKMGVAQYAESTLFGIATAHAFGVGSDVFHSMAGPTQKILPDVMKSDPRMKEILADAPKLTKDVADRNKISTKEAGTALYNTLTGTANENQRQLVERALERHPELGDTPLGRHVATMVRPSEAPQVFAHPEWAADHPVVIHYEDRYRNEQAVEVTGADRVKYQKLIRDNVIRPTHIEGPTTAIKHFTDATKVTKHDYEAPKGIKRVGPEDAQRLLKEGKGQFDKFFQGMPRLTPPDKTFAEGDGFTARDPAPGESEFYDSMVRAAQSRKTDTVNLSEEFAKYTHEQVGAPAAGSYTSPKPTLQIEYQIRPPYIAAPETADGVPVISMGGRSVAGAEAGPTEPESSSDVALRPAIRHESGMVMSGDLGDTHADVIAQNGVGGEHGFIDDTHHFISREEAGGVHSEDIRPEPDTTPPAPITPQPKGLFPTPPAKVDGKLWSSLRHGTFDPDDIRGRNKAGAIGDQMLGMVTGGVLKPEDISEAKAARSITNLLADAVDKRLGTKMHSDISEVISRTRVASEEEGVAKLWRILAEHDDVEAASKLADPETQRMIELRNAFDARRQVLEGVPKDAVQSIPAAVANILRDSNGTKLEATDMGDGSVSLVNPLGESTRVEKTPELNQAMSPGLTNTKGMIDQMSPTQLRNFAALMNKRIKDGRFTGAELDNAIRQQAEVLQVIKSKLGAAPGHNAIRTPEQTNANADRLDLLRKIGKELKGYKKGAITITRNKYGKQLANWDPIGHMSKIHGGKAYLDKAGLVTFIDRNGIPVQFPSREQAGTFFKHYTTMQADSARFAGEVGERVQRILDGDASAVPLAKGSQDKLLDPILRKNSIIMTRDTVSNTRFNKGINSDMLAGIVEPGSVLLREGQGGRELFAMARWAMDAKKQANARDEIAIDQAFDAEFGKGGTASVRGIEQGKVQSRAIQHITQSILDRQYNDGQHLGLRQEPRVTSKPYVPHKWVLDQAALQRGVHVTPEFLDSMVKDGMAGNRREALELYSSSGMLTNVDEKATLDKIKAGIMEQERKRSGNVALVSDTQAKEILDKYRSRAAQVSGSLEKARKGVPTYTDDARLAIKLASRERNDRLVEAQVFGPHLEHLNNSVDRIKSEGGQARAQRAQRIMDMVRGRASHDKVGALGTFMYDISRTELTLSALNHVPQNLLVAQRFGPITHLRALAGTLMSPVMTHGDAKQIGALFNDVAFDMRENARMEDLREMGDVSPRTLHALGFAKEMGDAGSMALKATLNTSRTVATRVGGLYADKMMKLINMGDEKGVKGLNELLDNKGTLADYQRLRNDPGAMEAFRNQVKLKTADWGFYEFDALTKPLAAQDALGRIFFQFKNFLYAQTRVVSHEIAGKDVPLARRMRAIMGISVGYPLYGYGSSVLRNAIGANTRQSKNTTKAFDNFFADPNFGNMAHAWVEGTMATHALGLFSDLIGFWDSGNYDAITKLVSSPAQLGYVEDMAKAARAVQMGIYHQNDADYWQAAELAGQNFGGIGKAAVSGLEEATGGSSEGHD